MGITTITTAAATAILMTSQEETTLIKEGHTIANLLPSPLVMTRCRLGLHSSRTGGGEISILARAWPL